MNYVPSVAKVGSASVLSEFSEICSKGKKMRRKKFFRTEKTEEMVEENLIGFNNIFR